MTESAIVFNQTSKSRAKLGRNAYHKKGGSATAKLGNKPLKSKVETGLLMANKNRQKEALDYIDNAVDRYRGLTMKAVRNTPIEELKENIEMNNYDMPYIITKEEYEKRNPSIGKRTYFVYDNGCTGELTFELISDERIAKLISMELLEKARDMITDQIMYVRNEKIEMDFELIRAEGNFEINSDEE